MLQWPFRFFVAHVLALALVSASAARQPEAPVREAVERFLLEQTRGLGGEVSVDVGRLDPRNQLPPCKSLTPFLPAASRAWGRTTVGVRCEAPAKWSIYVPATVRVIGEYLVLARALSRGQIVGPDDLVRKRGDLTSDGRGALTDTTQAIGHPARVAVAAGQPLRREMLLLPPVVRRGEQVRVLTSGSGFSVANQGRSLNSAAEGQQVRVRLQSGKVLVGIARHDGVVEIKP